MNNRYFLMLAFLLPLFWVSCESNTANKDRLPTDLIKNPNTAAGTLDDVRMPEFEFVKEFHDFGRVIQGEQVSFGFKFKNVGDGVLLISNVSATCGCTVASYPREPIKPGEEGVISVQFDSKGRRGIQTKSVTVLANTQPNRKQLTVQANVITPETMSN